jgi:hypothetical protein
MVTAKEMVVLVRMAVDMHATITIQHSSFWTQFPLLHVVIQSPICNRTMLPRIIVVVVVVVVVVIAFF